MTDHNLSHHKTLRTHTWLVEQLDSIWSNYFSDVERLNTVTISWGKHNRNRLGAITAKGGHPSNPERSEIRINSLLRNPDIPEVIAQQTIAHELAHYTHGFCSPHKQKYRHPHQGGVIEIELTKRGLGDVYNEAEAWLKTHWRGHVHDTLGAPKRRTYGTKKLSLLSHFAKRTGLGRRLGN